MAQIYRPAKKQQKQHTLTLNIESLDPFGQGIARHNGKTIFVPFALPGETVDATIIEEKRKFAKAKVTSYHNFSKDRITPPCPYYKECGGCTMQHLSTKLQLNTKLVSLVSLLQKVTAKTRYHVLCNLENSIADKEYHYRRRTRISIHTVKNKIQFGFLRTESNDIVNVEQCQVLTEKLNQLLTPLRTVLSKIDYKNIQYAELIDVESGIITILKHSKFISQADQFELITFAQNYHASLYLYGEKLVQLVGIKQHFYAICVKELTLKLTFNPLAFIQVNSNINQKMIALAINWLDLHHSDCLLDLYCGVGNFSLPAAAYCKYVLGVENNQAAVMQAKLNADLNSNLLLQNKIEFIVSDLNESSQYRNWLNQQPENHVTFNKILLDPARTGALVACHEIVKMQPDKIVYISCNAATLVRDSKVLTDAGYQINRIAILDMFPQTKHIESMLLFVKTR